MFRGTPWALSLAALLCGGCGPIWIVDPPSAERIARQENKPLLLYFKSWDSSQHRNMRMNVFTDPAVAKELKTTVNAELEFAFYPEYRARYGVRSPQVCIMCTPEGKKVSTPMYVNPVPTPEVFLNWLKAARQDALPAPSAATSPPPRSSPSPPPAMKPPPK
jgi:hypothetical protein